MPHQHNDGITANQCWPKSIITDPGFALLSTDKWYNIRNGNLRSLYAMAPPSACTIGKVPPRTLTLGRPLRRDGQQPDLDMDIRPEDLIIDNGNNTRRPTDEELWDHFGIIKCASDSCAEESKALGLELAVSPIFIPPLHLPFSVTSAKPSATYAFVPMDLLNADNNLCDSPFPPRRIQMSSPLPTLKLLRNPGTPIRLQRVCLRPRGLGRPLKPLGWRGLVESVCWP